MFFISGENFCHRMIKQIIDVSVCQLQVEVCMMEERLLITLLGRRSSAQGGGAISGLLNR